MQETEKERRNRLSPRGFTLLELMISLALLTLIVAITLGAMRLGSRSLAAGERKTEHNERLRMAIALLDAQVQSQTPLTHEETNGNKTYYFRGEEQTLQMATNYSLWGARRGSVVVNYRVEADNAGRQTLYAVEQTPGMEEKRETRLFTDASDISFQYFGKEPAGEEKRWSGQWTDETTIPEEIGLKLRYGAREIAFRFPVRARGDMTLAPIAAPAAPVAPAQ